MKNNMLALNPDKSVIMLLTKDDLQCQQFEIILNEKNDQTFERSHDTREQND